MQSHSISELLELSSKILTSLQEPECDFELLLELDAQRLLQLKTLFEQSTEPELQAKSQQLQALSALDKQIVATVDRRRQSLIKEVSNQRSRQKVKKAYR